MFRFISETFQRLVDNLSFSHTRYLYSKFDLRNRLTGLVGPRGVGKTTLMLQYIKEKLVDTSKCFYFSADLIYFQGSSLLEFVSDLHIHRAYQIIFIDEIHKYQGWNQELKNLYDAFPRLQIVFSGSSMLDLVVGSHDLSRRAKLHKLHGLSFREYLNFTLNLDMESIPLQEILKNPIPALKKILKIEKLLLHFEDYLRQGYYPFSFEDPHSYHEKLTRVIDKTVFEDIANYYNLKTPNLHYFKRILSYLASIPPGEFSINNLAKHLMLDHKTAEHYLTMLTSVGLIREMRPLEGGSVGLRKPTKIFLNNTNLIHTMHQYLNETISKGLIRELFFIQSMQNGGIELFYSKKGDYRTDNTIFEIGGKNKKKDQIKGAAETAFLVKDDILHPLSGEIPLFLFGFLY